MCSDLTQFLVRESAKHRGAQEADVRHGESGDAEDTVLISGEVSYISSTVRVLGEY